MVSVGLRVQGWSTSQMLGEVDLGWSSSIRKLCHFGILYSTMVVLKYGQCRIRWVKDRSWHLRLVQTFQVSTTRDVVIDHLIYDGPITHVSPHANTMQLVRLLLYFTPYNCTSDAYRREGCRVCS